jgi:hypothetical protein
MTIRSSAQASLGPRAIFLALGCCFSTVCLAQSKPSPMASVIVTKIKPDMAQEWESVQKELNAALKKGGPVAGGHFR